jgi:hypothetical protein
VEDGEEAAYHHVVDALVVVAHAVHGVFGLGRDDRMVVGDLLVVHHTRQREHIEPGDVGGGRRVLALGAHELSGGLDLLDHVGWEVA